MAKVKPATLLTVLASVGGLIAIAAVGLMLGYSFGEKALQEVSPTPGDPEIRPASAEAEAPQSSVPSLDRDTLLVTKLVKTLNPTPPPRVANVPRQTRPPALLPNRPQVAEPPRAVQPIPSVRPIATPSPIVQATPLPTLPTLPPVAPPTPPPPTPPPAAAPTPASRQGTVAMRVTSARRQGANIVLGVTLQNNTGRVVRFLYGLMSVTDENGRALSANTSGLPGELPPNGQVYQGTVSIPAGIASSSQSVSLSLADYPSRQLQLRVANVPIP
ncbi:MAG: hypothetical protein AAF704_02490 [Cyanobacteria bacterium P01_D01_bin.123]